MKIFDKKGTYVIDGSIMAAERPAEASSKMLGGFVSPISAAVIDRLAAAGHALYGAAGGAELGAFQMCGEYVKSEAVEAVKGGEVSFALCNALSGDVMREAALAGLYYIKPTYGTVSRFGVIPNACSMDAVGVLCRDAETGFKVLGAIAGYDPRDGAMYDKQSYAYKPYAGGIRAAYAMVGQYSGLAPLCNALDAIPAETSLFDAMAAAQYILWSAEFCNNTSRYDGIKFGYRAESFSGIPSLIENTRTNGFGTDVKLGAVVGSLVLSEDCYGPVYDKALRVRRVLKDTLNFKDYDVILLPASMDGDYFEQTALYAAANLCGLPCAAVPCGDTGALMLAAPQREDILMSAMERSRK